MRQTKHFENLYLRASKFYQLMSTRRSVRHFKNKKVPIEVINECIKAAGTAPSGANKQPWYFAIVTSDKIKKEIRREAEKEEYDFYHKRSNDEWLKDLKVFNTNWRKPHLEEASALIVIFSKTFEDETSKKKCYYPKESVGIATGILITALHQLGLSTLTHTPTPMKFLNKVLLRPKNEKPFLILAVGYKSIREELPGIARKRLHEICDVY